MDTETGEVLYLQRRGVELALVADPCQAKALRFIRLAVGRRLLPVNHRLGVCHRVPSLPEVEVWRTVQGGGAHFRGLMVCGSVWLCAVCAAKISERRRQELLGAMEAWRAEGGDVWLLTYTFSHGRHDDLGLSLQRLALARQYMRKGREFDAIRQAYGWLGSVQAFEITHGPAHGWHPHVHELIFVRAGQDREALRRMLYQRWRRACLRAGLGEPSERHGLDVRGGEEAGNYVTKWGMDQELTKGHIKGGRGRNRSPMQLLDSVIDPALSPSAQQESAALWLSYAGSIKGRVQLRWSPGLKHRFAVAEVSDEDLAAGAGDDAAELLASISLEDWAVIVRHGLQATVLMLAEQGNAPNIADLVASYAGIRAPH